MTITMNIDEFIESLKAQQTFKFQAYADYAKRYRLNEAALTYVDWLDNYEFWAAHDYPQHTKDRREDLMGRKFIDYVNRQDRPETVMSYSDWLEACESLMGPINLTLAGGL